MPIITLEKGIDLFETQPGISEFDNFKVGDIVYIIGHRKRKMLSREVTYPSSVKEYYIRRMTYDIARDREAFTSDYTSINFYLYIDLLTTEYNSDYGGIKEEIILELYYHVTLKDGVQLADVCPPSKYAVNYLNYELDINKFAYVSELHQAYKVDPIFKDKSDALVEFRRQSDSAARAMKEIISITAKSVRNSYNQLKDAVRDYTEEIELYKKFISCQCSENFDDEIKNTDDWLFLYLHPHIIE